VLGMQITQFIAIASTLMIFIVNALLALLLGRVYTSDRKKISYLTWSSGMRLFAIAILLELLFAFGVYSDFLAKVYLFAIAMPLLIFSIGYMQFVKSAVAKKLYYYYCIAIAFLFLFVVTTSNFGNIFQNYTIYGNFPVPVLIVSLIIGITTGAVSIAIALKYYGIKKGWKILMIIPGIALFFLNNVIHLPFISPVSLYYYQILGIIFIWLGLTGFANIKEYPFKI
jgi:hypothetical protein